MLDEMGQQLPVGEAAILQPKFGPAQELNDLVNLDGHRGHSKRRPSRLHLPIQYPCRSALSANFRSRGLLLQNELISACEAKAVSNPFMLNDDFSLPLKERPRVDHDWGRLRFVWLFA